MTTSQYLKDLEITGDTTGKTFVAESVEAANVKNGLSPDFGILKDSNDNKLVNPIVFVPMTIAAFKEYQLSTQERFEKFETEFDNVVERLAERVDKKVDDLPTCDKSCKSCVSMMEEELDKVKESSGCGKSCKGCLSIVEEELSKVKESSGCGKSCKGCIAVVEEEMSKFKSDNNFDEKFQAAFDAAFEKALSKTKIGITSNEFVSKDEFQKELNSLKLKIKSPVADDTKKKIEELESRVNLTANETNKLISMFRGTTEVTKKNNQSVAKLAQTAIVAAEKPAATVEVKTPTPTPATPVVAPAKPQTTQQAKPQPQVQPAKATRSSLAQQLRSK